VFKNDFILQIKNPIVSLVGQKHKNVMSNAISANLQKKERKSNLFRFIHSYSGEKRRSLGRFQRYLTRKNKKRVIDKKTDIF